MSRGRPCTEGTDCEQPAPGVAIASTTFARHISKHFHDGCQSHVRCRGRRTCFAPVLSQELDCVRVAGPALKHAVHCEKDSSGHGQKVARLVTPVRLTITVNYRVVGLQRVRQDLRAEATSVSDSATSAASRAPRAGSGAPRLGQRSGEGDRRRTTQR